VGTGKTIEKILFYVVRNNLHFVPTTRRLKWEMVLKKMQGTHRQKQKEQM